MIANQNVRCIVVVAPNRDDDRSSEPALAGPRFRPSDLLPWADPHIRALVENLQEEVRAEAAAARHAAATTAEPILN